MLYNKNKQASQSLLMSLLSSALIFEFWICICLFQNHSLHVACDSIFHKFCLLSEGTDHIPIYPLFIFFDGASDILSKFTA